jgi:hypothetical protein
MTGLTALLSGPPAFLVVPVLPRLSGRCDGRWLVIVGLAGFFGSCMLDVGLTTNSAGHDFTASQLLRGVSQLLAMMPLNQLRWRRSRPRMPATRPASAMWRATWAAPSASRC